MTAACCGSLWIRGPFMCCGTSSGFFRSTAVHRVTRVLMRSEKITLLCGVRRMSSSTDNISGKELRAALCVLSLSDDATDNDIKGRFHEIAKSSHPDVLRGNDTCDSDKDVSLSASTTGEKMRRGVEAYKLLRRYSMAERQMILNSSWDSEDAIKRAQRAYQGRSRSGAPPSSSRRRTAELNRFHTHMEKMSEGAPPWRVTDVHMAPRSLQSLFSVADLSGSASQAALNRMLGERRCYDRVNVSSRSLNSSRAAFQMFPSKISATCCCYPTSISAVFIFLVFFAMIYTTVLPEQTSKSDIADHVVGKEVLM